MQALAREAGVSVGLIYQYVSSKEDILLLVFLDILEGYREEVPAAMAAHEDPVRQLAAGFRAYCTVMARRPYTTVLAYRESSSLDDAGRERIKELESETIELLANAVQAGIDAGIFVDVDPHLIAYDLVVIAQMWALKRWYLKGRLSLEDYIRRQFAILVRSMLAPAARRRYSEARVWGKAP
jgi:AcrR family transcriptional regulator